MTELQGRGPGLPYGVVPVVYLTHRTMDHYLQELKIDGPPRAQQRV